VFVSDRALADLPIERLEAAIAALGAELTMQLERWLALVAEFDHRGGARRWGFRGTTEWLAWRCGLTQRTARDHVRVARALRERPLLRDGLARGELSYSKVRALARTPGGEGDAALVELARRSSAGQVERVVRGLRSSPSAGVDVAQHAYARRYVDWWWEPDGSLSIRGRLPAEDGAAFIEMVETAAAAIHPAPIAPEEPSRAPDDLSRAPEEPSPEPGLPPRQADERSGDDAPRRPPLGARRADALAEIAHSGSPRTNVVLHVDEAALACTATAADERAGETCRFEDGAAIPSETARRVACDAAVLVARRDSDGAIDYGRSRRVVPAPLRTVLERRDRRCRFPGCERRHDLHAHHVQHWAHGGGTSKDNLVLLCRFHHRLVHEDGFTIRRSSDGTFEFRTPTGRCVSETPARHHDHARARGQPVAA
jgi:Domain of unknown function (DUF222)/HNH endonuclease